VTGAEDPRDDQRERHRQQADADGAKRPDPQRSVQAAISHRDL
jgi:hypothetical protein